MIPDGWYQLKTGHSKIPLIRHRIIDGRRLCNRWVRVTLSPVQTDTGPKCLGCLQADKARNEKHEIST
jgi:hypothetical protein